MLTGGGFEVYGTTNDDLFSNLVKIFKTKRPPNIVSVPLS